MSKKALDHYENLIHIQRYSKLGVERMFPLHHDNANFVDTIELNIHTMFRAYGPFNPPTKTLPCLGMCLSDMIMCLGFSASFCTAMWLIHSSNLEKVLYFFKLVFFGHITKLINPDNDEPTATEYYQKDIVGIGIPFF